MSWFAFFCALFIVVFAPPYTSTLSKVRLSELGYRQVRDLTNANEIWEQGHRTVYIPLEADEISQRWKEYRSRRLHSFQKEDNKNKRNDPYMRFIPQFKATLRADGKTKEWNADCFQSSSATLILSPTGGKIVFNLQHPKSLSCYDTYLILDRENWYFKVFVFHGQHVLEITQWKDGEYNDITSNGLQIFTLPDGLLGSLEDVIYTLTMFNGRFMAEESRKMIEDHWNYTFKQRKLQIIDLDPSFIESGDYFTIRKWDGLCATIMLGTGSHSTHTAIAQWIDGELYVCESMGQTNYWPPPWGIIKTPYRQWIQQAIKADYEVVLLKLSPEARARYNATSALKWFQSVEGLPYGYHNFLFGWIDTPKDNYPPPLNSEILLYFLILFQHLDYNNCNRLVLLGLNQRVGTQNLGIYEILEILRQRNLTFEELLAIPEQDSWIYPDGLSMVCDVFVMSMYKAGGLLEPYTKQIQATEFTPRDSYQMDFFLISKTQRPPQCQVDDLPYCQILGKYQIDLPGASTIKPYSHMFERCGALPPHYVRHPYNC
jgi:hypothetical protein